MDPTVAIEPLQMPDKAAARYMSQFHIAALAVFCPLHGMPCQPVATDDLAEALAAVRKAWPKDIDPPTLARAWWVSGLRPAQQIVSLALACDLRGYSLDHGRLSAPVTKLAEAITAAARRLKIGLTDYQVGLTRVQGATTRLAQALDDAAADGALKFFNAEYRRRRQEAQQAGNYFMSYGVARARLQDALGKAVAGGGADAHVIAMVFGDGSGVPSCSLGSTSAREKGRP